MRGAVADLPYIFREAGRRRWTYLAMSAAITIFAMSPFFHEGGHVQPRLPYVIYINSYAPGRSEAEIIRSNIANQKLQDRLAARAAAERATERKLYMALGRASGFDVDQMAREADAEAKAGAARPPAPARASPR